MKSKMILLIISAMVLVGVSCNVDTGDLKPPESIISSSYKVGGVVVGLAGGTDGLILANNTDDLLFVSKSGNFSFTVKLKKGDVYDVTITQQPANPAQVCSVTNGTGTMGSSDISNIVVTCTAPVSYYTVGGTVTGLVTSSDGVALSNLINGAVTDTLTVSMDGSFTISANLVDGDTYLLTVQTNPASPAQTCSVTGGSGTIAGADVSIQVTCAAPVLTYSIGGSVSGLVSGSDGVLLTNGVDSITVTADGLFTISTGLSDATSYSVVISASPATPVQTCSITGGSGIIAGADVDTVSVVCLPPNNFFSIGGTLTGLDLNTGGIELQLNGSEVLLLNSDGAFNFQSTLLDASTYSVTVLTDPSMPDPRDPANPPLTQTCAVTAGSGTVSGADVTTVAVTCNPVAIPYLVGGTVSGLVQNSDGVVLDLNGVETIAIPGNGSFSFSTNLYDGDTYLVQISSNPAIPAQNCNITGGSGVIAGADISGISIICDPVQLTIGGILTGLTAGQSIVLQNNGADNLTLSADGSFTFATSLTDGSPYSVTILTPPGGQSCSISNGSGALAGANIDTVQVTCATNVYTVGGTVSGLAGTGLTLQNNGVDNLSISVNGAFTFASSIPEGGGYNVTVLTQPTGLNQTCSVSNSGGTVPATDGSGNPIDITDVAIVCTTNTYAITGSISGLQGSNMQLDLISNAATVESLIIPVGATSFAFANKLPDGSDYTVSFGAQPTSLSQTCSVTGGAGTLAGSDVAASVSCVTNSFTVGGTITGLPGGSSVTLEMFVNGPSAETKIVSAASFTFNTSVLDGSFVSVSVNTNPAGATCSASSNTATINGANIGGVVITCATNTYTISGVVSNYTGTGLTLQLNGGNNTAVPSGGTSFTFTNQIVEGGSYSVTVLNHPTSPLELCTVTNGTGTNILANVINVSVSCSPDNAPVANAGYYSNTSTFSGFFQSGTAFLNASGSTDDSGIIVSYTWLTSATGCTFGNNGLYTPTGTTITCTFDSATYQAVRLISVAVRVSDGRNAAVTSPYVNVYIFNPAYTFVKAGGTGAGLDPDYPAGSIQTAIDYANSYSRSNVAVQNGTYNVSSSTAITMRPGISVRGGYYSAWTSRSAYQTTATILNHTYSTVGVWAYTVFMSGTTFTSATEFMGFTINAPVGPYTRIFYIKDGAPTVKYNYIRSTSTGTTSIYGIYCANCTSTIEGNLIDMNRFYGILLSGNSQAKVYNNMVRIGYGYSLYITGTGTNWQRIVNNTIINTYSVNSIAVYISSSSSYTLMMNNIIYAHYGIYEGSTTGDVRTLYNNDFYGPAGFVAYRDADAACTLNYDLDGSAYTCNYQDVNSSAAATYRSSNIAINPGLANLTALITANPTNFQTTSLNADIRFGARYEGAISKDFYGTTRTSGTGSTLAGAYGWSIGADED